MKKFVLGFLAGVVICCSLWWVSGQLHRILPSPRTDLWPVVRQPSASTETQASGWACSLNGHFGDTLTFTSGADTHSIASASDTAWSDPILTADGRHLFAIAHDRLESNAYNFRELIRIDLPPVGSPWSGVVPTCLLSEADMSRLISSTRAWVTDIHSVSLDGSRILISEVILDNRSTTSRQFFVEQPFVFDTTSKTLKLVEP
jgi:hypothetical protein